MNRYGHLLQQHHRTHRPDDYSQIPNPDDFFADLGEEMAADVTRIRDQILGPTRPDETANDYRLRSYQALATAEEVVLADHLILQPDPNEPEMEAWEKNADLDRRYRLLNDINEAINQPL